MSWHIETEPAIREEVHFTDRPMRCFSKRPQSINQMLREAVARNGTGDAIVDGDHAVSYRDLDATVSQIA